MAAHTQQRILGHDSNTHSQFDTKRSELGELVFRLNNRSDRITLAPIADTASEWYAVGGPTGEEVQSSRLGQ